MQPHRVSAWRNDLPYPFNEPRPRTRGRPSEWHSVSSLAVSKSSCPPRLRRANSAAGALENADRTLSWLRYLRRGHDLIQLINRNSALQKLRGQEDRCTQPRRQSLVSSSSIPRKKSRDSMKTLCSGSVLDEPTIEELAALTAECFPRLEDAVTTITEYSESSCHVQKYTLEEVLRSKHVLGPPHSFVKVRWIHVDYHKLGTFWGSSVRFLQWGSDPILFEQSPIILMQERSEELDRDANRSPLKEDELQGYKHIGRYHRQAPGSPEFIGLRNKPAWLKEDKYQLLMRYLENNHMVLESLKGSNDNDIQYGLSYISARNSILEDEKQKINMPTAFKKLQMDEDVEFSGMWDDHVERLEFYREHTLFTCGSSRLYDVAAQRLQRKDDPLRAQSDSALLYYTLVRVSIENDDMMKHEAERDLNKLFKKLKNNPTTDENHTRMFFGLQQKILDGLEYLEENRRELRIWGIPPFGDHLIQFHHDFAPSSKLKELICAEMDLVAVDFDQILGHWRSLKSQIDRHLDLLIQFRVLDQQELAVRQSDMAARAQILAADEARTARAQAKSVSIFTFITVVFVPLGFFTSYFGIHLTDINENDLTSNFFWSVSAPSSITIIAIAVLVARWAGLRNKETSDLENAGVSSERGTEIWLGRLLRLLPGCTKERKTE